METISPEFVGQYYDQTSQFFELLSSANIHYGYWPEGEKELPLADAQEKLTEMMLQRMPLKAGQHLIDVGCGLGRPSMRLARETGCKVTGITVSQVQVDEANQRAGASGLGERAIFKNADAMAMPFEDASFDAAWAIESLLHMPDRQQVIREMKRVVVPGGRIAIADMIARAPMTDDEAAFIRSTFLLQSAISLDAYQSLLKESGLEVEEVVDISLNTMQTLPRLMESFEKNKDTLQKGMGEEAYSQYLQSWGRSCELYQRCLGYAIFVARKPSAS